MKIVRAMWCLAAVMFASAGCQEGAQETRQRSGELQGDDVAKLYQASCSECHLLARTEHYDGDGSWQEVVDEMIEENGAKISPEDAKRIVAYLDQTYPR